MQQPIGRPRAISTASSRDRELFLSKLVNPSADIFPTAIKDSNTKIWELFSSEVPPNLVGNGIALGMVVGSNTIEGKKVLPSLVGNEDEDNVAFNAALGMVVGSNTIEGNGAAVVLNSRDSGGPVGCVSGGSEYGLYDNADGELVGESVETMLGVPSRLLQKGDCGCIH